MAIWHGLAAAAVLLVLYMLYKDRKQQQELLDARNWTPLASGSSAIVLRASPRAPQHMRGVVLRLRLQSALSKAGPLLRSWQLRRQLLVKVLNKRYVSVGRPLQLGRDARAFHDGAAGRHGMLLRNLMAAVPAGVCIELKPKWGALPVRRHGLAALKARACRFCMQQSWKLARGRVDKRSAYCPLRLFSTVAADKLAAVCALMETPQNNFAAFAADSGDRLHVAAAVARARLPSEAALAAALVAILQREHLLLYQLQQLQRCDEEDIERVWAAMSEAERAACLSGERDEEELAALLRCDGRLHRLTALQRLLLSATAKDVSILISMRAVTQRQQQAGAAAAGVSEVVFALPADGGDCRLCYSIGLADLDFKSPRKLRKWKRLDEEVIAAATEQLPAACAAAERRYQL